MSTSVRTLLATCVGCFGIVAIDQYTKHLFFGTSRSFFFLDGWIQSIEHRNFGIAFNLPIPQWLILGITLVACIAILWIITRKQRDSSFVFTLCLGILLGGAIGNAIDRATLGFVRDWLLLWFRSAINLADIGVLVGLIGALSTNKRVTH